MQTVSRPPRFASQTIVTSAAVEVLRVSVSPGPGAVGSFGSDGTLEIPLEIWMIGLRDEANQATDKPNANQNLTLPPGDVGVLNFVSL